MATENLTSILREYEQRKLFADREFSKKLDVLYEKVPRLQEIDSEINKLGILLVRSKLASANNSCESTLKLQESLKLEKVSLLRSLHIDIEDLKPTYSCTLCNDTGFISDIEHVRVKCSCLKQKMLDTAFDNSNLSSVTHQNFDYFDETVYSDLSDSNSQNISPRQNILNIKNDCHKFISNFDNPKCPNMLFTGNTGLGKTFVSNCIAYDLLNKGKTVLYQTAPILLENIIGHKMNSNSNGNSNIYYAALSSDLLIIDDLGTESMNSMKLSELFNIINARILSNKKTIISTNLNINQIFSKYEERIGSRIAGYYNMYNFYGNDIRLNKYNSK